MGVYICQKHGYHKRHERDTGCLRFKAFAVDIRRQTSAPPEVVCMVGYCNRHGVFAVRLTSQRPVSGQSAEGTFVASLCTVCLKPFCGQGAQP